MNIKLLRAIQRQIKKEPKQFIMVGYFQSGTNIPNCGTAACIAGWAYTLNGFKTPKEANSVPLKDIWKIGMDILWYSLETC